MFGLFSSRESDSKVNIPIKPFKQYLGGTYFATQSIADPPKQGQTVNLKAIVYLRGDNDIVIAQNYTVTGNPHELQID